MQGIGHIVAMGAFVIMAFAIIFVKAGQNGGMSGGTQTSIILDSASGGAASTIKALEGG